jgi:hypothetical protein
MLPAERATASRAHLGVAKRFGSIGAPSTTGESSAGRSADPSASPAMTTTSTPSSARADSQWRSRADAAIARMLQESARAAAARRLEKRGVRGGRRRHVIGNAGTSRPCARRSSLNAGITTATRRSRNMAHEGARFLVLNMTNSQRERMLHF